MLTLRRAADRGHADHGWLDSHHTFSFAGYLDPRHMGFRALRVLNDDRVAPGRGFGAHPHRDMEIVTYVLDGAIEHKDSMGNGSTIRPGDVQRMTAGTGVTHSELNPQRDAPLHFLQIWILPEAKTLTPGYEQRRFEDDEKRGKLRLVASRDGRDGSVTVHQNVSIYSTLLGANDVIAHEIAEGRHLWVQVVRGAIELDDTVLGSGDGAAVSDAKRVTIKASAPSELLVFDLA